MPPQEAEWIRFVEGSYAKPHATRIWAIVDTAGITIGWVKWWAAWRKYTFHPTVAHAVFDEACLRRIADFCEDETRKHKAARSTR